MDTFIRKRKLKQNNVEIILLEKTIIADDVQLDEPVELDVSIIEPIIEERLSKIINYDDTELKNKIDRISDSVEKQRTRHVINFLRTNQILLPFAIRANPTDDWGGEGKGGISWADLGADPGDGFSIKVGADNSEIPEDGYEYGEVGNNLAMRFTVQGSWGRGWVWSQYIAQDNVIPVMSLNADGNLYVKRDIKTELGDIDVESGQILSGGVDIATLWGGGPGGTSYFSGLTDTPADYIGHSNKLVRVDSTESNLEFISMGSLDHGNLNATSLLDNDHPQYRLTADTIPFSGIGSTAHTHEYSTIQNTGHTHENLENDLFVSGNIISLRTGTTYENSGSVITGTIIEAGSYTNPPSITPLAKTWDFNPYDTGLGYSWNFIDDDLIQWRTGVADYTIFFDDETNYYHIIGIRGVWSGSSGIYAGPPYPTHPTLHASNFLHAKTKNFSGSASFEEVGIIDSIGGPIGSPIVVSGHNIDNIWAPHLIKHDNAYYMFYTGVDLDDALKQRIFCAKSYNLEDWSSPEITYINDGTGPVWVPENSVSARDPYVQWDEDKNRWMMFYTVAVSSGSSKIGRDNPSDPVLSAVTSIEVVGIATSTTLTENWELVDWIPATEMVDDYHVGNGESPNLLHGTDGNWYLSWSSKNGVWTNQTSWVSAATLTSKGEKWSYISSMDGLNPATEIYKSPYQENFWILGTVDPYPYSIKFMSGVTFTGSELQFCYTSHTSMHQEYSSSADTSQRFNITESLLGHINEDNIHMEPFEVRDFIEQGNLSIGGELYAKHETIYPGDISLSTGTTIMSGSGWSFAPEEHPDWSFIYEDDGEYYQSGIQDFTVFWNDEENLYHIIGIRGIAKGSSWSTDTIPYTSGTYFLHAITPNFSGNSYSANPSNNGSVRGLCKINIDNNQVDMNWAPHILKHDGAWYMFYTGPSYGTGDGGLNGPQTKQKILVAKSYDINDWESPEIKFLFDGDVYWSTYSGTSNYSFHCRDPYVHWEDTYNRWIMLVTVEVDSAYSDAGSDVNAIGIASASTLMGNWELYDWYRETENTGSTESASCFQGPDDNWYIQFSDDLDDGSGPDTYADSLVFMSGSSLSDTTGFTRIPHMTLTGAVAAEAVEHPHIPNTWMIPFIDPYDTTAEMRADLAITFTGSNEICWTGHSAITVSEYTSSTYTRNKVNIPRTLQGHINEQNIHFEQHEIQIDASKVLGGPDYTDISYFGSSASGGTADTFGFRDHLFLTQDRSEGTAVYWLNNEEAWWATIAEIGTGNWILHALPDLPSTAKIKLSNRSVEIDQNLEVLNQISGGSFYVNPEGDGSTSYCYYHNGTSYTGASINFDHAAGQFNISTNTNLGGNYLATDGDGTGYDLYLNTNASNTTRIWFGNSDGAYNTHSLSYDTTDNRFEFSHALHVDGEIRTSNNVRVDNQLSVASAAISNNVFTLDLEDIQDPVTSNETNYYKGIYVVATDTDISSGVEDSGYRIGLAIDSYINNTEFQGTLDRSFAIWARAGTNTNTPTGTIDTAAAIWAETLSGSNTTINNLYGIYQSNSTTNNSTKNWFAADTKIGPTEPGTIGYRLEVEGNLNVDGSILLNENSIENIFAGSGHTHTEYTTDTEFDSHTGDSTIHFTEASIDIDNIVSAHTHSASQITSGTFGSGDYTFQSDVDAQGEITADSFDTLGSYKIAGANINTIFAPISHTHNASGITAGSFGTGDYEFDGTVTADTFVINSGITYPNGILKTKAFYPGMGLLTTKYWTYTPTISNVAQLSTYAGSYSDITPSGTTPASTDYNLIVWVVPNNWKTGTSITFDYGFGVSSAPGSLLTKYVDLHFSGVCHTFNPVGDESNYLGREYSSSRSRAWSVTGVSVCEQTFVEHTGFTLTTDGQLNGADISPGDQLIISWNTKQSEFADPGCDSSTAHAGKLVLYYYASDNLEDF